MNTYEDHIIPKLDAFIKKQEKTLIFLEGLPRFARCIRDIVVTNGDNRHLIRELGGMEGSADYDENLIVAAMAMYEYRRGLGARPDDYEIDLLRQLFKKSNDVVAMYVVSEENIKDPEFHESAALRASRVPV
jgi:hypothetical protein